MSPIAQTLSRSSNSNEIQPQQPQRRSRSMPDLQTLDPKENYNESKLMNALFARYI